MVFGGSIFDVISKLVHSFTNNLNVIQTRIYNHEIIGELIEYKIGYVCFDMLDTAQNITYN